MKKTIKFLLLTLFIFTIFNCKNDDVKPPVKQEQDTDNDGVIDKNDLDPKNPNICRDIDKDGCDDCTNTGDDGSGGDVNNDGEDTDGDGICDTTDEDIDNDGVKNEEDSAPKNPNICRDTDKDGCDDCINTGADNSGGDPKNDGEDIDFDGICDDNDPDIQDTFLQGILTSDRTLDASKSYLLKDKLLIADGATLTIPEGTVITALAGKNYIAVLQGGKININGTAEKPVVMKGQGNIGDWGGLIICGNSTTTKGINVKAEVDDLLYGGSNEADNSGAISYLIIKDSGFNIIPEKQFNGLSLYAVGSNTTVNNIAIINGNDDGIEFFGGTVNVTNIYLKNNADDSIDWTQEWKGSLTNSLIEFDTGFAYQTIVEADGEGITEFPTLKNLKATASKAGEGIAFQFKNHSNATFSNVTLNGGFQTLFEKSGAVELSAISVNGAAADNTGTYNKADDSKLDFSWVAGK